jgi:hypothetical protein
MFKIVSSFSRANFDYNFFYHDHNQHPTVLGILEVAENTQGFLGLFEIVCDDYRHDLGLGFETAEDFQEFIQANQVILNKRSELISEYCRRTGHEYKYYIIENKECE